MSVCLICLIGLPAVGKTNLCKKLCDNLKDSYDVRHIEFDEEIEWGSDVQWKQQRSTVFEKTLKIVEDGAISGRPLLIFLDDNMFYRSMRYTFYQMSRNYQIGFSQLFLKANLEDAIIYDARREKKVGREVIENISNKLEEPGHSWEVNTLNLNAYKDIDVEEVRKFIIKCLLNPVRNNTREELSHQCHEPNELHIIDLALRKTVGHLIREFKVTSSSNESVKNFSDNIGKQRMDILNDLKSGKLHLDIEKLQKPKECIDILLPLFKRVQL